MRAMDAQLIENARQTLADERDRLRLELSEEVEHPRVAHGAQTAAATEVTGADRITHVTIENPTRHLAFSVHLKVVSPSRDPEAAPAPRPNLPAVWPPASAPLPPAPLAPLPPLASAPGPPADPAAGT